MIPLYRAVFLALAWTLSSAAMASTSDWQKWAFQRLTEHPDFQATLFVDEALIMKRGEDFYAAFAVVKSAKHRLVCAYAVNFQASIGFDPGIYSFKPRYICGDNAHLKAYDGLFNVKYPCDSDKICPTPAIGVGNLLFLPEQKLSLDDLPAELSVKIDVRMPH